MNRNTLQGCALLAVLILPVVGSVLFVIPATRVTDSVYYWIAGEAVRKVDARQLHEQAVSAWDKNQLKEAYALSRKAATLDPSNPIIRSLAGLARVRTGVGKNGPRTRRLRQAVRDLTFALNHPQAEWDDRSLELQYFALMIAQYNLRRADAAAEAADKLLAHRHRSSAKPPREALAIAAESYLLAGKAAEGVKLWREIAATYRTDAATQNAAAWTLATADDSLASPEKAIQMAQRACRLTDHKNPEYLDTLAVAHARAGQFDQAVAFEKQAIAMTTSKETRKAFAVRLERFQRGEDYREKAASWRVVEWQ